MEKRILMLIVGGIVAFAAVNRLSAYGPGDKAAPGTDSGDFIQAVVPNPAKSRCFTLAAGAYRNISTVNAMGFNADAVDSLTTNNAMPYQRTIQANQRHVALGNYSGLVFHPKPNGAESTPVHKNMPYVVFKNPNSSSIVICTERNN